MQNQGLHSQTNEKKCFVTKSSTTTGNVLPRITLRQGGCSLGDTLALLHIHLWILTQIHIYKKL